MPRLRIALIALFALAPLAAAQDADGVEVNFDTADKAVLKGNFYRGTKGGDSPVAMLIHRFGSDRSKGDWTALAKLLASKGIAAFTFDLRGHGDSREVANLFWNFPHNKNGIRGYTANRPPREIALKDFKPNYFPALINDVVAARRQIDQLHADGKCNSNNLFIIGADEGASLGMMWASIEWSRNVVRREDATGAYIPLRPASRDLGAAVWLSPRSRPQNANFRVADWFKNARDQNNQKLIEDLPQCIFFGAQDPSVAADARNLFAQLDPKSGGRSRPSDLNFAISVPTRLQGLDLLNSKLEVAQNIIKFLEKVADKRSTVTRQSMSLDHQPFTPVDLNSFGFRF